MRNFIAALCYWSGFLKFMWLVAFQVREQYFRHDCYKKGAQLVEEIVLLNEWNKTRNGLQVILREIYIYIVPP